MLCCPLMSGEAMFCTFNLSFFFYFFLSSPFFFLSKMCACMRTVRHIHHTIGSFLLPTARGSPVIVKKLLIVIMFDLFRIFLEVRPFLQSISCMITVPSYPTNGYCVFPPPNPTYRILLEKKILFFFLISPFPLAVF